MRRRAVVFALSYLCAILYLSLYPGTFLDAPVASGLHWVVPEGRRAILDTLLNLLFYMPFGLAIGLAVGNWRISVPVVALLSGACSLAVEWAQLWTITRHGNLLDWGTNTFGACVGAAGAALVARLAEQPGSAALLVRWKLAPVQQLFTVTWLSWFALPFVPRISLPNAINQVIHPASWVWRDFETAMGGFAVLRVILGPSPWLYIAGVTVLLQAVLVDRTLSYASVAGAIAAWLITARVPRMRQVLMLALPAWVILDELRPFTLSAQAAPFSWVPFESWFSVATTAYYATIFQKMYFLMAAIWLLHGAGWRYRWTGPALAAVVLGCEWMQRYLPGRTPETTDAVLALIAWGLLKLTESEPVPCSN